MNASPAPNLRFDLEQVALDLGARSSEFALRWVESCGSTNTELMNCTPEDDGRVHVLVAGQQTAGRGRRGRVWLSWPDSCLTFSALWRFAPGAPVPAGLSLVTGLAVAVALEKLGVEGLQLKWPNDVLIHGRKLAGILVELLPGRGRTPAAVIGIGVNRRLPDDVNIPGQAGGVTDLQRELGHTIPAESLLAALLTELHALFETYAAAGFGALRGAWQQRNAFAGLPVTACGDGSTIYGTCAGVDDDGALLIRTDTDLQRVLSGEISLRLAP